MTKTTKTMKARFYTNTERYMGYCQVSDLNYLELRSWLLSGNYLVIGDEIVQTTDQLDEIFKNN